MKLNIYMLMALSLCLVWQPGWAQNPVRQAATGPDIIRCYSVEMDREMREQNPELGSIEEFEAFLAPLVEAYKEGVRHGERRDVTVIPMVFHIIHNGEAVGSNTNVDAQYVQAQIDQLNNDFRKIEGTSGYNDDTVGADSEIEFCLAVRGPDGTLLDEPGINRINRNDNGWTNPPFTTGYIQNTIKSATVWDSERYLNIWCASISGGILGYAQFPNNTGLPGLSNNNGTAATDGVVIVYNSLGSTETPHPTGFPYNQGRTLTHELGHYFGLRHIWGDPGVGVNGCSVDDFCDDTPNQQSSSGGNCPSTFTCSSQDMTTNYMDYSNDVCMNIFTFDQKARMQAVIAGVRSGLGDFHALGACDAGAPFASFSSSATGGCEGSSILFVDNSTGSGLTERMWDFGDGGSSMEESPVHTYNTAGSYDVTLTVGDGVDDWQITKTIVIGSAADAGTFDHLNGGNLINELAANEGGTSGYVGGHNSFGDNAKAEYFAEGAPGTTLGNVDITFAVANGPITADLTCTVWNSVGGEPGDVLASVMIPISAINTDGTPTSIDFGSPVLEGPFFVGVELNYNDNTDVSVFTNENGDTDPVTAWERWSDGTWHPFNDGTEFTWGWDCALAIEAEIACEVGQAPSPPIAAFSAGLTSVCLGDPVLFMDESVNDPDSWMWDFGDGNTDNTASPSHTYAAPGTYTVTLTVENFAGEATETKTDYIVVNDVPAAPTVTNSGGGSLSASDVGTGTYQWYLDDVAVPGGTGMDFQATEDGQYYVEFTDANGCVSVSAPLGVLTAVIDAILDGSISVYPNPVSDLLTVEFKGLPLHGNLSMTLVDVTGRQLQSTLVDQAVKTIDMASYSAGVYLLQLQTDDGRLAIRKIVKQQ